MGNRDFIKKYFEGGERVHAHPRYRLSYATESAYWLVLCIFVWYYLKNAKKRHHVANWEKAIGCWLAVFFWLHRKWNKTWLFSKETMILLEIWACAWHYFYSRVFECIVKFRVIYCNTLPITSNNARVTKIDMWRIP